MTEQCNEDTSSRGKKTNRDLTFVKIASTPEKKNRDGKSILSYPILS